MAKMNERMLFKKNLDLSWIFHLYTMKHPEILKGLPFEAEIIMGDIDDLALTEGNLKAFEKEKGERFQAMKLGRKWEITKITKAPRFS
jgi:hypothetical protein